MDSIAVVRHLLEGKCPQTIRLSLTSPAVGAQGVQGALVPGAVVRLWLELCCAGLSLAERAEFECDVRASLECPFFAGCDALPATTQGTSGNELVVLVHSAGWMTEKMSDAEDSVRRVVAALEGLAKTSPVWAHGLVNPGGPHRRLQGHMYPISIGEDECIVFGRLVERYRPEHCYIIGNAFGFSSAYIADVMMRHGGKSVTTLDNQSEGHGREVAAIAQGLTDALGLSDILTNCKGSAPQDIPATAKQSKYELIFIDGLHRHPQVTHDFLGMLPYCNDDSIVVFHDSWIVGVPEAAAVAKQHGFRCLWVPTSCEMILATRDEGRFAELQALFPHGVEDKKPMNYALGYMLYLREVMSFRVNHLLGRA